MCISLDTESGGAKATKKHSKTSICPKILMTSGTTPKSGCMELHIPTGAEIVVQGIHHSSALKPERNVGNVTKIVTSRWYEGPHGDAK